jgi:hypothetical protein
MASVLDLTPSKQVIHPPVASVNKCIDVFFLQAANALSEMNIGKDNTYSVASLKEKFARAARGKENAAVLVGKKHIIDEPAEQDKKHAKAEEEEEPLLVENKKRFVLFPIKYHEVAPRHFEVCKHLLTVSIDLANVQKGRGLLLDGGGD